MNQVRDIKPVSPFSVSGKEREQLLNAIDMNFGKVIENGKVIYDHSGSFELYQGILKYIYLNIESFKLGDEGITGDMKCGQIFDILMR